MIRPIYVVLHGCSPKAVYICRIMVSMLEVSALFHLEDIGPVSPYITREGTLSC